MVNNYLDELNESQRAAVLYNDGPSLVIAGAGSGKTRVLTYKIAHLMNEGYAPWNILALTFTNKAAEEIRHRIEESLNMGRLRMNISTFQRVRKEVTERLSQLDMVTQLIRSRG